MLLSKTNGREIVAHTLAILEKTYKVVHFVDIDEPFVPLGLVKEAAEFAKVRSLSYRVVIELVFLELILIVIDEHIDILTKIIPVLLKVPLTVIIFVSTAIFCPIFCYHR